MPDLGAGWRDGRGPRVQPGARPGCLSVVDSKSSQGPIFLQPRAQLIEKYQSANVSTEYTISHLR